MKKILFSLLVLLTFSCSLTAQALLDTTSMQSAADLYRFKSQKNNVPISPIAPLAIHQRADNKLMSIRSTLQGQISNIDAVLPLKLNSTDAASTYATNTRADSAATAISLKANKSDSAFAASRFYLGGTNQFLAAAYNSPDISTLGLHLNGNGKQIFVGDNGIGIEDNGTNTYGARNVTIGEADKTDGDVLEAHGKAGIRFSVGAYKAGSAMESGWKISGQASNAQPILENYGRVGYKGALKLNELSQGSTSDSTITINTATHQLQKNLPLSAFALKTDVGLGANSVYYVDRRWTGTRGGSSWTAQNSVAIRGNISYAYPDLWAARNAAVIDLKAGTISKAVIYVFGGNSFSFSNVVDGSNDYESATFEAKRYDMYNSDTTSTNTVSLLYNNLDYYFEQNTTLVHNGQNGITVPFCDGTTSVSSSVRGFMTYKANYGQGQGKNTQSIIVRGVNSKIVIDVYKWDSKAGWNENYTTAKEFTLKADIVYRVTGAFLITGGSNGSNVKVNVGSFFQGKYAGTDFMVDDCWAIFSIGGVSSILKNSSIAIDIKQASVEESCDGLFYMQSLDTSNVKINFGTLLQASRSNHTTTPAYIINAQGGTWNSSNVTMDIGIHNGDMGLSQIQCTINKSQVAIDCGVCNVNNSAQPTKAAFKMWNSADSLSSVVVTGNYRSISNPIVEVASATNKMVLDGTYRTTSSNAAIVLSTNAPLTLLKGQVYSSGTNSISATSANSYITILPSATANKAVSSNVVTQGASLNVNSLFKL